MLTKHRASVEDLHCVPDNGKAEIIKGEIFLMSPTGTMPGRAAGQIFFSLRLYEAQRGGGYAFGDNVGFLVNLPGRDSFSPDAAWYVGPLPGDEMDFLPGAPVFAAEVRSKNDYGAKAERAIVRKIADYFAAGTQVVWDVDLRGEAVIKVYRAMALDSPTIYRRGDEAEAEPAVPGWRLPVDDLFRLPTLER